MLLGDDPPPRTYVLSNETKRKIEENRKLAELYSKIHSEGLTYVGYEAFKHLRPMQWVQDPTLRHSYMSTAAMYQAGASANKRKYEGILSELASANAVGPASWLADDNNESGVGKIVGRVIIDVLLIIREAKRLTRIENVEFRVIQSTERRVVFGANVIDELESQDDDAPDPLQSDIGYDEEQEVNRYLEATFDQARLEGFPQKHVKKYRKLIFQKRKYVFRLRLGKQRRSSSTSPFGGQDIPGRETAQGI